jgi:succinylglutamic semialdehyde dehydrogenase
MSHPTLSSTVLFHEPSNLIGADWLPVRGSTLRTHNPANPDQIVFECEPKLSHVGAAVASARAALGPWSRTPRETRFAVLRRFAELSKLHAAKFADVICDEVGKVMWEARAEASILAGKVDITLDPAREGGLHRVSDFDMKLSPTRTGHCTFKPHGVVAVLGPFNFPAHLPNGHIVPALAMGNTVVFKPSDKASAVGQLLVEVFDLALREVLGAKYIPGVVNLVHGRADVASALVRHEGVDAIAFTGSWPVGRKILEANLDRPGRIVALELGGSNPAVVMDDADLKLAAVELARGAFVTTGQRCTCTRRAIIHESIADRLLPLVVKIARSLIIAPPRAPSPVFTGPLNNQGAVDAMLNFQRDAENAGADVLVHAERLTRLGSGYFVSPSIIRVDRFSAEPPAFGTDGLLDPGADLEIFGPLLRYTIVRDFDDALEQANASRYGLAASIFTMRDEHQRRFLDECRAGCINVNTGTAGASSKLPFGGLGLSGNHRPAGSFALDYCAYPVATMVESQASAGLTMVEGMDWDDAWLK